MDSYYAQTKPRILEYCGRQGGHPSGWDSEFVVAGTEGDIRFRFADNNTLGGLLELGADIYRSLWSRLGSLFLLDLSTYADPLHLRFLRCVGSYHQKSARRYATLIRRQASGAGPPGARK